MTSTETQYIVTADGKVLIQDLNYLYNPPYYPEILIDKLVTKSVDAIRFNAYLDTLQPLDVELSGQLILASDQDPRFDSIRGAIDQVLLLSRNKTFATLIETCKNANFGISIMESGTVIERPVDWSKLKDVRDLDTLFDRFETDENDRPVEYFHVDGSETTYEIRDLTNNTIFATISNYDGVGGIYETLEKLTRAIVSLDTLTQAGYQISFAIPRFATSPAIPMNYANLFEIFKFGDMIDAQTEPADTHRFRGDFKDYGLSFTEVKIVDPNNEIVLRSSKRDKVSRYINELYQTLCDEA